MALIHQIMDKSLVIKSQKRFCKPSKTKQTCQSKMVWCKVLLEQGIPNMMPGRINYQAGAPTLCWSQTISFFVSSLHPGGRHLQ